ncbi:MAG: GNAT family N-acetyltransferase [Bacteroidia bacterium]
MNTPEISTDKSRLNIDFIFSFLSTSYWASERSLEQVKSSIDNSLCFGLYQGTAQIGFARIITDQVVCSYLMDVFIDPKHQNKSYGKFLMEEIYKHPTLRNVKTHYLITKDAQNFYKNFGFNTYPTPDRFMLRINF